MNYRLSSYHNGLGDCLQFTTLPEMFWRAGHQAFLYVAPENDQVKPFRNLEIKSFVWGANPYLPQTLTPGQWNAGDTPDIKYENKTGNFIKNWELAHGLEPENSFPVIYPLPNHIDNVPSVLVELSGISLNYDPEKVRTTVNAITDFLMSPWGLGTKFQISSAYQENGIQLPDVPMLGLGSLSVLYDYLCSAPAFISLSNGVHSLAAAARRRNPLLEQWCILPEAHWDFAMQTRLFVYPEVHYIKEGEINVHNHFRYEP